LGKDAKINGEILETPAKKGVLVTTSGGKRLLFMLEGENLSRIC